MKTINSKILFIVLLSTIFGLASGAVGTLLTRVYLLEESFNFPMFGEIDLSGTSYHRQGLVISNPKKVVVEQNTKVVETVKSASTNIVGIFEKKEEASEEFNLDNYYKMDNVLAEGLIITSDGWILSNYIPQELKAYNDLSEDVLAERKKSIQDSYVIMTNDEEIYNIDNVLVDDLMSISFWHVSEVDFPVKKFVHKDELKNGQMIVGVNWDKDVFLSSILQVKDLNQALVKNSDDFFDEIVLADVLKENFDEGFFFNVNGNLVAMRDLEGDIIPIYSYLSCINCLLGGDDIIRPSLGINYINLSNLVPSSDDILALNGALIAKNSRGIAVRKGSLADLAGLEEGDIIISVNNLDIDKNNDLSDIISEYNIGDELLLVFERDGEENSTTITLNKN